MKNIQHTIKIASVVLLACALLRPTISLGNEGGNGEKSTKQVQAEEVRGVWLTNVDSDLLFSPQNIDRGMKKLAENGFNVVFPVVWHGGFTLYPSDVMEETFGNAYRQDSLFREKGLDPLEEVIFAAHRYGMEVIPWFEFGFISSHRESANHILNMKPEWAAKKRNGKPLSKNDFDWMNPFHPEVQELITGIIMEVVRNYDVDGIQGDHRLPAFPSEGGYNKATKELFRDEVGQAPPKNPFNPTFLKWKSEKITDLAQQIYEEVKAADEELIVSYAPVSYPRSFKFYLQDIPQWIEKGYVDLLVPQIYYWQVPAYKKQLRSTITKYPSWKANDITVVPGIALKFGNQHNDFDFVNQAIGFNREMNLPGEIYFYYEGLFEKNNNLADSLSRRHYKTTAMLPYRTNDTQNRRPKPQVYDDQMCSSSGDPEVLNRPDAIEGDVCSTGLTLRYTIEVSEPGRYDVFAHHTQQNSESVPNYKIASSDEVEVVKTYDPTKNLKGWQCLFTVEVSGNNEAPKLSVTTSPRSSNATMEVDALMAMPNHNTR